MTFLRIVIPLYLFLFEHDLFEKRVPTPHQVRGRLFPDHALNRWLVTLTCLEIAIISSEFRIGGHAQIRRVSAGRNDMKRCYASCAVAAAMALGGWAAVGKCRAADRHAVSGI